MKEELRELSELTPIEILNYFRNRYYADGNSTENGIVANALNDIMPKMVVLPCKIGDTVYSVEYQGCAETCTECDYYSPYDWGECDKGYSIYPRIDEKNICPKKSLEIIKGKMSLSFWGVNEKHFGKTVFLTREAAEEALKAREQNA